ncbi:N-acylglucosamine 2-epimerase [Paludibacter propionicigenes WB4]|uniref:Cellobiose 2-epimerase n=1 Tax=Paludibacter propionicigenes (strain DSM 17365 / JCM 13257 / WB4) TaxID=694427 RepID=E4T5F7_PALPW|nr:AGE family epimerase/isomerase [Paludibacter propionicigenes]ADQ79951.1 N-acylglucosamine 2-epimerase [Paludibacter propionicigenes WB4]
MKYELLQLKQELKEELTHNILPFWMDKMIDDINGGYYGQMTGRNQLISNAPKGGILNARIMWTFSSAALYFNIPLYTQYAKRAKDYAFQYFFDTENGGTYWMLNADGSPVDTKKQIYSQAFFIYALVEYYRVTNDAACLDKAIDLFRLIEKYSFDATQNGYFEAYSKEWVLLEDLRLSEKDANEKKTMNTHLHILEAYTNLYRIWKNEELAKQLKNLIDIFLNKIINSKTYHLDLFFDENWNCKSTLFSYGHDIEAAWLLEEAAVVLGNADVLKTVRDVALKVADAAAEGIQSNGSIVNEKNSATGHVDTNCDWWPQAEAMVGFFSAYELSKNETYAMKTLATWEFIKANIIDTEDGEWHWSVSSTGKVDNNNDKAGFWKCPYHNGRMCLELMHRIHD